MERIIKKVCLITILFLAAISIKVYANELTIDSKNSINPETENTLEYVLKGNFTEKVNSIKVRYTFSDGMEFKGFTPSEEWNLEQGGTAETTGLVLRISDVDVTGNVEFGKFIFTVPSTYNKDRIDLKLYGLDATNTACDVIDFDDEEVKKSVNITKADDSNDDNQEDNKLNDDKPGVDNSENNQGTDDSNIPSGSGESGNKNEGNSTGLNPESGTVAEEKNNNELIQNSSIGKDTTVTNTIFGQYGSRKIVIILISIVSVAVVVVYKKMKKYKYIK